MKESTNQTECLTATQLNNIFKELLIDNYPKKYIKPISSKPGHQGVSYTEDGIQGEYNETVSIYELVEFPDLYLKVSTVTDSYGEGSSISAISFVRRKTKEITVYEVE